LARSYASFSNGSRRFLAAGYRQEQLSLANATAAIYSSRWAVDSAIRYHSADPAKLHVIPFAANVEPPDSTAVERAIALRGRHPPRILFVGREWPRKGGGIVLETVRLLRAGGLAVELDLVGPPALPVPIPPYVRHHGPLSHKEPAERARLRELFLGATLLFVPSRAEAYGMIFCEAAAFGLPAVTTAVGGIPEVVLDGETGVVLPLEAGPEAYAAVITALVADHSRYSAMSRRAREEYAARLNWDAFGARARELIVSLIERRAQAP
jgi:glycosyltransferase involved in cell wall biosynthesis